MIHYDRSGLSHETLTSLYTSMLKPRLVEEKMLILLRQGKVTKWFSGIGQEGVSAGVVKALDQDEYILPLHRNLGIFTGRNLPLNTIFAQLQGKKTGFTKGRDRSFHFGSKAHYVVGMISHLGAMLPVADGISLAHKLLGKQKVTLAFSGEGGSSEGDFHEALNVAAVWKLPVIFLVENNGYGLSTPASEQFAISSFTEKAGAYGIDAKRIDGNNVLEVYNTVRKAAEAMRDHPKPILIEAVTFRMRGHEEGSSTNYVPDSLFEEWAKKDPLVNFERFLLAEHILTESQVDQMAQDLRREINNAWEAMEATPDPTSTLAAEIKDLFAPFSASPISPSATTTPLRMVDALKEGLDQALNKHKNLVLMGQDIAEYGGVFKVTEGLSAKYGKDRVRNTPLCESAILGCSLGLSIMGYKSVVEMQFADFVSCGFNQLVNNLAKSHYRWGQAADVVVRMPTGAGVGAGPFHSQSTEAWFYHVPGLKIVYPSSPYAAKGLLLAAIEEPNPVLFFEHKALYRSVQEDVPTSYYTLPIGKANTVQSGTSLSVITYGMAVHWVLECARTHKLESDIEVIDLQTLSPIDYETLSTSVKKTGRVLLLTEDTHTGSIMAEVAAWIGSELFHYLDAPIVRLSSADLPVPFSNDLENMFLPKKDLLKKIQELLAY